MIRFKSGKLRCCDAVCLIDNSSFGRLFVIGLKATADCVPAVGRWLSGVLNAARIDAERIKIAARKLLAEASQLSRSGRSACTISVVFGLKH